MMSSFTKNAPKPSVKISNVSMSRMKSHRLLDLLCNLIAHISPPTQKGRAEALPNQVTPPNGEKLGEGGMHGGLMARHPSPKPYASMTPVKAASPLRRRIPISKYLLMRT